MLRSTAALVAAGALVAAAGCTGPSPTGSGGPKPESTHRSAAASRSKASASASAVTAPTRVVAVQEPWRLPMSLSRGVVVPVHAGVVLAGGLLPGDVSTPRAYRIDLAAGRTRPLAPLVAATHDAAGARLRGRPAVFGGGSSSELSGVQRLGADGSWHAVGRLPGARSDLSTLPYKGDVVVLGGYDGVQSPRSVLRTRDGARFTTLGRLPRGVRYAAVAVVGRTAWVIGGEENHQELREVFAVDLRSGRVRSAGRLPHGLGHASAVVVGDRILVMGGRTTPDRPTAAMWWFQPSRGSWHRAGRLPYPVADAATAVTRNAAYLLGGETPDFTDRVTKVTWH